MSFWAKFMPGFRMIDGDELNKAIAYPNLAHEADIVATPAGTVNTSVELTETINHIVTSASAGDGVLLPKALPGAVKIIINAGGNTITVFAKDSSTINGTAGATGVVQNDATRAMYVCAKAGAWWRLLGV